MDKPLVKNVMDFIDLCSKEIGKFEGDEFNQIVWSECQEKRMESPIEQILYCALRTITHINYFGIDEPVKIGDEWFDVGLGICPQVKIGKYRIDFEVSFSTPVRKNKTQDILNTVLIECDSQQFHERTEQERRYEKARDRYLLSKGYKIFHYTGKEILDNPLEIAREIIAFLTKHKKEDLIINYPE